MQQLKNELKNGRAAVKPDLIIKYIKCTPKIITINVYSKTKKSFPSFPNLYYQNVVGLNRKLHLLNNNLPLFDSNTDILIKTWLSNHINLYEIGFNSFTVFTCERNLDSSSFSRGVGVLISIN